MRYNSFPAISSTVELPDFTKWVLNFYPYCGIIIERYPFRLAEIAQLVEHFTRNEGVEGSSPFFSLMKALCVQGFFCFKHF